MNIIADSSATRTEWVIVEAGRVVDRAFTSGMNPYFQTRRELSHAIRLELPESYFKRRWNHIYLYGAGCANQEKRSRMERSLVAQFRSAVTVESDLLGAARGLFVDKPGIACIIGTGSNSCFYNGTEIVRNVPPLGYVLGDEGSSAYFGKLFLADVLKGLAPEPLSQAFFERQNATHNMLMNEVYAGAMPSRTLARYGLFLADFIDDEYAYNLVYNGFMAFFRRNVATYDYADYPLGIVGSTAVRFERVLRDAAAEFGIEIAGLIPSSMPGLIQYHSL